MSMASVVKRIFAWRGKSVCQCRKTGELLAILSFRDTDDPGQGRGVPHPADQHQLLEIAGLERCCKA
jgi:hypothetical protein